MNISIPQIHAHAGQGIILPPPALRDYVKYFWYYNPELMSRPSAQFRIIPSGFPGLIFQHDNGNPSVHLSDGYRYPLAFAQGQDTRPCVNIDKGSSSIVGVRLSPTGLKSLFHIDSHEATDAVIPLDDLAGYNLTEQLLHASGTFEVINLLSEFLLNRIRNMRFQDMLVEQSIEEILKNIDWTTPRFLSNRFYISPRQLQRRFKYFIGVSPERYIQILKFQKSINVIQQNHFKSLTDIAYELGYSDQSHFIRQFRSFSGLAPKEALKHLSQPGYSAPPVLQNRFKFFRLMYL